MAPWARAGGHGFRARAGGGAAGALRPPRGLARHCPGPAGRAWGAPSPPGAAGRGAHHARRALGAQAAAPAASPGPGRRGSGRSCAPRRAGRAARQKPRAPSRILGRGAACGLAAGRTVALARAALPLPGKCRAEPLPALFKESPDVSRAGPPSPSPARGPGPPPPPSPLTPSQDTHPRPVLRKPRPKEPRPARGGAGRRCRRVTPPGGWTPAPRWPPDTQGWEPGRGRADIQTQT